MRDVLVLCYHAVSAGWVDPLAVTPDQLHEQLSVLRRDGYRAIRFSDVECAGPGRWVAVTFDDAFRSVVDLAAPVLADVGLTGTVFAPTAYVGSEAPLGWPGLADAAAGPDGDHLVPASWDELARLTAAGWEVGSHTHTHPRLVDVDDERLRDELATSRALLTERLGTPCTSLAYPYGSFDARVEAAAATAGYRVAAVLDRQVGRPRTHAWPRVGVYRDDSMRRFRLKVSRALRTRPGAAALVGALRVKDLARPGGAVAGVVRS